MNPDLPYCVDYAKSSRSSCQNCKKPIAKETLRLAVVVQSPVHDSKVPRWYHAACFFVKQRPKSAADIANFDNIRWEDQQDVKKKIEEAHALPAPTGRGRKRASAAKSAGVAKDFTIQYSKSNRATCIGCEEKIVQSEIRVSKKDFESEHGRKYGGIDRWYHFECFVKLRQELEFYEGGNVLPGFGDLSKEDQKRVKSDLPKLQEGEFVPVKKMKEELEDVDEQNEMKKQNEELFKIRGMLSPIKKSDLISILEKNEQQIPEGISNILDRLSDAFCFGALKPCSKCSGQLVYTSGVGYKCTGDLSEWTKCEYVTQDPKRKKISIPSNVKQGYPDLESLKCKVKRRLIKVTAASTSTLVKKEDEVDSGPKVQAKPKPLKHMQFFIIGRMAKDKNDLKKEIINLGGEVSSKLHENIAAVISTQKEIDKMSARMEEAESLNIQVITEDFLEEAKEYTKPAISLIKKKTISTWGGDLSSRINVIAEKSTAKSKAKSSYEKSGSGKMKLQLKDGGMVDPDSELQDVAHVYKIGKNNYTVTLVHTDIQSQKNSYYKLQILEHDKQKKYWLFRSWGRIGTTIGGTKVDNLAVEECIKQFEFHYEDKTGNVWSQRDHFVKVPQKMYPVDVDHGEEVSAQLLDSDIKSELEKPVQDLIRMLFDEQNMKKVMAEFEIDVEKMPLGKITKKQIQKAYSVLTNMQDLLKNETVERLTLIDASNKFYNLIPHNFGVSGPKILDTVEEIHTKCEMLDALLEMEIAYSLLHTKVTSSENPLDAHYKQLNADIKVLDKESNEYKLIEQYVQNTHATTHKQYDLEIEDVFVVKRSGEDSRFKPFKKLPNRKLLWHGSRTTNYAGILSQGLRKAPPEAPVTGYMFGKGIYFADMVSKSANYCCTNSENSTGLMLLCEVALGNMYERYSADFIEKLPSGKHSTFGRGQTQPNPETSHKTKDGVEIPLGTAMTTKLPKQSALLYNEYIVYDVAQVKIQYLLKMKFRYKM
ncbi:poly-(ADP-ribose) polymerase [Lasioglossum baleicum]|uniref:poly-(ADP-ribose) polymerase n=1 Tax=Lasioglossum baleicum TaxID=434251 RepID=UPI003FCEA3AE